MDLTPQQHVSVDAEMKENRECFQPLPSLLAETWPWRKAIGDLGNGDFQVGDDVLEEASPLTLEIMRAWITSLSWAKNTFVSVYWGFVFRHSQSNLALINAGYMTYKANQ